MIENDISSDVGCRMYRTYRTCRAKLTMSGDGGEADLSLGYVEVSV